MKTRTDQMTCPHDFGQHIPSNSLLHSMRRIGMEYAFRLQSWGLPAHTMATLLKIYTNPETAEPSRLAADEVTQVPRQTMTFILDTLEQKKLVHREEHPQDRRRKMIRITPAGTELAKKVFNDLMKFEKKGRDVVPPELRQTLREIINEYINALIAENDKLRANPQPKI